MSAPGDTSYRKQWDRRGTLWLPHQSRKLAHQVLNDLEKEIGPLDDEADRRVRCDIIGAFR